MFGLLALLESNEDEKDDDITNLATFHHTKTETPMPHHASKVHLRHPY